MRRISLTLASLLLITQASNAQEVKRLSMKDCMEYAVTHNATVKNSKIDILIQDAQNKQTLSASYPHINGKVELNDFFNPQQSFVNYKSFGYPKDSLVGLAFMLPYASNVSLTASQLVFDGAVFIAWKARNSVMELAKLNSAVSEETVRYNVYKAYNSIVIAYRQFDIIKQSLTYARSLGNDIEITRQNGFAEMIDVERTNVQINNLASDSIRVGNMLTLAEQLLKYQMGMDINAAIVLTDTSVADRNQHILSLLNEQTNYDRIPLYNVLNTSLTLNKYNLRRFQLTAWPSVNIYGSGGLNYGSNKFSDVVNPSNLVLYSMAGLQVNVPIFNGSLRTNQVKEARYNIEKSQNNIDNMKLTIDLQAAQSRTSLKNSLLQVQSQKRNMDLANNVLDLAQKKYKAGVGSNIEVTQAQTDVLRAQTNYFSALLDEINAEADLKKALGQLAPGNIN